MDKETVVKQLYEILLSHEKNVISTSFINVPIKIFWKLCSIDFISLGTKISWSECGSPTAAMAMRVVEIKGDSGSVV